MKRYLPFLIIALVGIGTLSAGIWLFRDKQTRVAAAEATVATTAPAPKPDAKRAHTRGDEKAPVTIEEFADFQCPPCGGLAPVMKKLEEDFHGRVRVIFRHYPLPNHQHAQLAGTVAEAAGFQGRFWEMHDMLYKNQLAWHVAADARPLFNSYAQALGLDMARFAQDIGSPEAAARITADKERAALLGVKQTPTLFVNDELVPVKSLSPDGIRGLIEQALQQKSIQ